MKVSGNAAKKPYTSPVFTDYGTVEQQTKNGDGSTPDGIITQSS